MLLNSGQAQAIYKAMHALNDRGGQLLTASFDAFAIDEAIIDVCTHFNDRIELRYACNITEVHADLSAFASAYVLQTS